MTTEIINKLKKFRMTTGASLSDTISKKVIIERDLDEAIKNYKIENNIPNTLALDPYDPEKCTFDILGKQVVICEQMDGFAKLNKIFSTYSREAYDSFLYYYSFYDSFENFINNGFDDIDTITSIYIDKALAILIDNKIYDIDEEYFREHYFTNYKWPSVFDEIVETNLQIEQKQEELDAYRTRRRQNRAKLSGDTVFSGLAAGAVNTAIGTAHGIFNLGAKYLTSLAAEKAKDNLFSNKNNILKMAKGIAEDIFYISIALCKVFDDKTTLNISNPYKNYEKGCILLSNINRIKDLAEKKNVLISILQDCPIVEGLFDEIYSLNETEYFDNFIRLATYFNADISNIIDNSVESIFSSLNINDAFDCQTVKDKVLHCLHRFNRHDHSILNKIEEIQVKYMINDFFKNSEPSLLNLDKNRYTDFLEQFEKFNLLKYECFANIKEGILRINSANELNNISQKNIDDQIINTTMISNKSNQLTSENLTKSINNNDVENSAKQIIKSIDWSNKVSVESSICIMQKQLNDCEHIVHCLKHLNSIPSEDLFKISKSYFRERWEKDTDIKSKFLNFLYIRKIPVCFFVLMWLLQLPMFYERARHLRFTQFLGPACFSIVFYIVVFCYLVPKIYNKTFNYSLYNSKNEIKILTKTLSKDMRETIFTSVKNSFEKQI